MNPEETTHVDADTDTNGASDVRTATKETRAEQKDTFPIQG